MNPARIAALRLGMGDAMPAFTVQINCGSGMQSIDTAYQYIREGHSDLILAGGAEALSQSPLIFRKSAVDWYAKLFGARSVWSRLAALAGFRPSFLKPVIGLERGLTDPVVELNMGQTAEILAHLFHISRHQADEYAAESQWRLARAQREKLFDGELEPAFGRNGTVYDHDDGVRPDTTVESLAKLKPAFERPWGKVTAGNSSQITDGASWVILASEQALKQHGLTTTPTGGGDVAIKPIKPNSAAVLQFKSGQLDGGWEPEPYATEMVLDGGKRLVNEASLWPGGKFVTTNLVVTQSFLKAHPSTVNGLLKGQIEANSYINSDPTAAAQAANGELTELLGKGLPSGVLTQSLKYITFTNDPIASSLTTDAQHAVAVGLLKPVNLSGIYDLGPLNKLLQADGQPQVSS